MLKEASSWNTGSRLSMQGCTAWNMLRSSQRTCASTPAPQHSVGSTRRRIVGKLVTKTARKTAEMYGGVQSGRHQPGCSLRTGGRRGPEEALSDVKQPRWIAVKIFEKGTLNQI